MKMNMGQIDRFIRTVIGFFFLTYAIAGGPWWAYLGLALLITAAWRVCPFYAAGPLLRSNSEEAD